VKRKRDVQAAEARPASRASSRRRFLKLFAAGTAAMVAGAGSGRRAAAATPKRARRTRPARLSPIEAEIKSQKEFTARALKTIRDYVLPPGSDPAFVFRPLKASRPTPSASERGRR
jgi:hypothetical protein